MLRPLVASQEGALPHGPRARPAPSRHGGGSEGSHGGPSHLVGSGGDITGLSALVTDPPEEARASDDVIGQGTFSGGSITGRKEASPVMTSWEGRGLEASKMALSEG